MRTSAIFISALFLFSCSNQTEDVSKGATNLVSPSEDSLPAVNAGDFTISSSAPDPLGRAESQEKKSGKQKTADFSKLYKKLEKPGETFLLDADKDKTIVCKEGTKIVFKANSFVTESGKPVTGEIKFNVKEYYEMADILLANLTTMSDQHLLETGGMIHLEAFTNGEKCVIKKGSSIDIGFPFEEKKKGMELFKGEQQGDKINWKQAGAVSPNIVDVPDETSKYVLTSPATFQTGPEALNKYLIENLKYPFSALNQRMQGIVLISFVITKTGAVSNVSIARSAGAILDKAASDLISNMPNWNPAKIGDEAVAMNFSLPIHYRLTNQTPTSDELYESWQYEGKIKDMEVNYLDQRSNTNRAFASIFEDEVNDQNINLVEASQVSRYMFSSANLGWINCDRFIDDGDKKTDYFVKVGDDRNADLKIIFKDIRSIMQGDFRRGKHVFANVPEGREVTLVALKKENGQYYLAIKETSTSKDLESELYFEPVTMAKLKQEMAKLN